METIDDIKSEIEALRVEILKTKESLRFLSSKLYGFLFVPKENSKEDVTVVIDIRDRFDYRIENVLKSLRNQDYGKELIKIILVDYGSRPRDILPLKKICEIYEAEYLRTRQKSRWSRSCCLNIGIKRADTKYILTSDVDIIFEKNYIREAVAELQKNPFQLLCCEVLDSTEGTIDGRTDVLKDYQSLKINCVTRKKDTGRYDYVFGMGIIMTLRSFFVFVSGFDENYHIWGLEDDDIVERFKLMGLELKNISCSTSYIHQWHPKFKAANDEERQQIEKNGEYFRRAYSIVRNKKGWGEL